MKRSEVLKYISDTHRHLHDERRRYEIKFFLSCITLNVLAIAAVLSGRLKVSAEYLVAFRMTTVFAILALAGICIGYLYRIHKSNRRDIDTAFEAERELFRRTFLKPEKSHSELSADLRNLLFFHPDGSRDGGLEVAKVKRRWSFRFQAATVALSSLISAIFVVFADLNKHAPIPIEVPPIEGTAASEQIHYRWLLGLFVSLGLGTAIAWIIWKLLHSLVQKTAKSRNWTFDPGECDTLPYLPLLIGLIERLFFTCAVAFEISGIGGAIGSWIIVKMVTGWNRVSKPGPQYRMLAFSGLIASLVSIFIGVIGGLVVNGSIAF